MKSVLIVDDDADILLGLRLLLEDSYKIEVAQDGVEALERIKKGGIDLIVLDLMMPVLDGAGLMRELRTHGLTTPVIIVSAHARVSERARELRAAGHLSKPFKVETLETLIADVLSGGGGSGSFGSDGGNGGGSGGWSSSWGISGAARLSRAVWEQVTFAGRRRSGESGGRSVKGNASRDRAFMASREGAFTGVAGLVTEVVVGGAAS